MGLIRVRTVYAAITLILLTTSIPAQENPPDITAPIVLVADATTGTIIYEKNPEMTVSPASLAKMMTLHLTAGMDNGMIVPVPLGGSARDMRPGSSIIGLTVGDKVTVGTLRRATAVASAGDAAWTLALLRDGNASDFVAAMNSEAARLGMEHTTYSDPDGWSSVSKTCGKDQMALAIAYIKAHESELSTLHALPRMVYDKRDELANHRSAVNTNLLIGEVEGVDGLKTGTIPSEGFHMIATAKRGETRFIALVMGIRDVDYVHSVKRRADEAGRLLEWAFANYGTVYPEFRNQSILIPVRHGSENTAMAVPTIYPAPITLEIRHDKTFLMLTDLPEVITAPVIKGETVGFVRWFSGSTLLAEAPFVAQEGIERRWRMADFLGMR